MKDEILKIINEWDPIGIKNVTPDDEYSYEVEDICVFFNKNKNIDVNALKEKIDEIFIKWFGADIYSGQDSSEQVAKKIIDTLKLGGKLILIIH